MQRAIIMEVPINKDQLGEEAIGGTGTQGLLPHYSRVRKKLRFRWQRFRTGSRHPGCSESNQR
jgi:hypothetical protein